MITQLPTYRQRLSIHLSIAAKHPVTVAVHALDTSVRNTYYLKRKLKFTKKHFRKGKTERWITISLPLSPKYLTLDVFNATTGNDNGFIVKDVKVKKMEAPEIWASEEDHRFIDFAMRFAQGAGYERLGFLEGGKDREFLIQYLPIIRNAEGEKMVTPARTHRITGRIQVAANPFRSLSIPIRMFILLHEWKHFSIPTRVEKEADLEGLNLYLDLGFSSVEANYAATKIFKLHPDSLGKVHVNRARDIQKATLDYHYSA